MADKLTNTDIILGIGRVLEEVIHARALSEYVTMTYSKNKDGNQFLEDPNLRLVRFSLERLNIINLCAIWDKRSKFSFQELSDPFIKGLVKKKYAELKPIIKNFEIHRNSSIAHRGPQPSHQINFYNLEKTLDISIQLFSSIFFHLNKIDITKDLDKLRIDKATLVKLLKIHKNT